MRLSLFTACLLLLGCPAQTTPPDAATTADAFTAADAYSASDAPQEDAFSPDDAGRDAFAAADAFASMDDAWTAATVFSTTGSCGVLDTELTDTDPHWVQNVATFPEGWTIDRAGELSTGAQQILSEGTAGGSSGYSEAFAFEMLHRCEGAGLVASETMIRYSVPMPGAITDILVEIDGLKVGVSVSRAVTVTGRCMRGDTYPMAEATRVLTSKLNGIRESSMLVAPEDRWVKQILFIYADTAAHAATLRTAWDALDPAVRADSVLYVSVSEAMDSFIYFQTSCP
jgi:hypothetical protein